MEAKGQIIDNTPIYYKDKEARDLLGDEALETEAQTCTGAINELKQSLTDLGFGTPQVISNITADFEYTVPSYGIITGYWRGDSSSSNKTIGITSNKLGANQYRVIQTMSIAGGYDDINIIVVKGEKLKFAPWINVLDYKLFFVPFTS